MEALSFWKFSHLKRSSAPARPSMKLEVSTGVQWIGRDPRLVGEGLGMFIKRPGCYARSPSAATAAATADAVAASTLR